MSGLPRSVVVECCGMPGAGKSFVVRGLFEHGRALGAPVNDALAHIYPGTPQWRRVPSKLLLVAAELARAPIASARLIRSVARSSQAANRDYVARSVNLLMLSRLIQTARHRPGVHLFDQGIVQELVSVAFRGDPTHCVEALAVREDLVPDVIIVVKAPLSVVESQLNGRPHESRIQAVPEQDRRAELARVAVQVEELLGGWIERLPEGARRPKLLRVDNPGDESLERTVLSLWDEIIVDTGMSEAGEAGEVGPDTRLRSAYGELPPQSAGRPGDGAVPLAATRRVPPRPWATGAVLP